MQLSSAIFGSLVKGVLPPDQLVSGKTANSATSFLIYNQSTGSLYYDDDANGTDVSAFKIAILGTTSHPNLVASDFVIV